MSCPVEKERSPQGKTVPQANEESRRPLDLADGSSQTRARFARTHGNGSGNWDRTSPLGTPSTGLSTVPPKPTHCGFRWPSGTGYPRKGEASTDEPDPYPLREARYDVRAHRARSGLPGLRLADACRSGKARGVHSTTPQRHGTHAYSQAEVDQSGLDKQARYRRMPLNGLLTKVFSRGYDAGPH
jgi:hypothetical protein